MSVERTFPLEKHDIWQKSPGVVELVEKNPDGSAYHVEDLHGRWTRDLREGIIRPWRPEDDMNFLQRAYLEFLTGWRSLMEGYNLFLKIQNRER